MEAMGSEPSGKRSLHSIAARASSGVQAAGRGIPQLILDGLPAGEHVIVARMTCHPMQMVPTLFFLIAYAQRVKLVPGNCRSREAKNDQLCKTIKRALRSETDDAN